MISRKLGVESKFYSRIEESKTRKGIKTISLVMGATLLIGVGLSLLLYFLANRDNYLIFEILLCLVFSIFLCLLFFEGTYFLAPKIGKLSLIKEIRKTTTSIYKVEGYEIDNVSIFVHENEFVSFKFTYEGKSKSFYIEKSIVPNIQDKKIIEARIQNRYVTSIKYE